MEDETEDWYIMSEKEEQVWMEKERHRMEEKRKRMEEEESGRQMPEYSNIMEAWLGMVEECHIVSERVEDDRL